MRRERCWGERKRRSVSVTFFSRRHAECAGWQPQRGGRRRTGQRAGRSGDGPLAPKRQSRRDRGRASQSKGAAAVEAESECPQEPAQQAGRPCPTWNQNGRTSTSLLPDYLSWHPTQEGNRLHFLGRRPFWVISRASSDGKKPNFHYCEPVSTG